MLARFSIARLGQLRHGKNNEVASGYHFRRAFLGQIDQLGVQIADLGIGRGQPRAGCRELDQRVAHPKLDANSSQELGVVERLEHVVVRPNFIAVQSFPSRSASADEDHLRVGAGRAGFQPSAGLIAVDTRHVDVHQS